METAHEFGKRVYDSVERIVLLSVAAPVCINLSARDIKVAIAKGRIGNDFYTLVHNFGDSSTSSGRHIQVLGGNGVVCYTVLESGKSDRELPLDLLSHLESFVYSD